MREEKRHAPAPVREAMPGWAERCHGEPALQELLDDPIMGLLWRRDRLEPRCARQRIGALGQLVRRTNRTLAEAA